MNWEAISAVSDLLASIAVVVSLIYLAIQVRQSNVLAQGQTRRDYLDKNLQEIYLLFNNPDIWDRMSSSDISADDKVKLHCWLLGSLRQREFEWNQHRHGIVDDATYAAQKKVLPLILETPRARAWWHARGKYAFNPEFVKFADALMASTPPTNYWTIGDNW